MHGRGAGGHHHPVELELANVVLNQVLARLAAHVFVVAGHGDVGERSGVLGDFADVDDAGDVGAAVADVDAYSQDLVNSALRSTGRLLSSSLPSMSSFGDAPIE